MIELVLDFLVDFFLPESKKKQRAEKKQERAKKKHTGKQTGEKQSGKQRAAQPGGDSGSGSAGPGTANSAGTGSVSTAGSVSAAGLPGHDSYFLPEGAPLPKFSYQPQYDGEADPGEVVWAWVPFEDDPSVGKDRPVLVLAKHRDGFVCAQMTSKDHQDFKETQWGRRWMDIGTGDWDRQRRPSEVRLDRFVFIPAHSVRREGGRVSQAVYSKVVEAIQANKR